MPEQPWEDKTKPIQIGAEPRLWFFDGPAFTSVTIGALDALSPLEALAMRIEQLEGQLAEARASAVIGRASA